MTTSWRPGGRHRERTSITRVI
uniref:Uncharacterized protein n=1 Tax=Anguilla anguilla TaxID=7936 RepID=A0A0E9SUB1_ANGAN